MSNYIMIGIVSIVLIYLLVIYNKLVHQRNYVKEAFSTMDIYLKKRWDLIPNLVETVKAYAKYEEETIEKVTKLRVDAYEELTKENKLSINEKITKDIWQVVALSENYPDLKANENFLDLCKQLTQLENDIANARKYYNGTVRILNNTIQMFPSNIIATIFGFKSEKMFAVDSDNERNNINVEL